MYMMRKYVIYLYDSIPIILSVQFNKKLTRIWMAWYMKEGIAEKSI